MDIKPLVVPNSGLLGWGSGGAETSEHHFSTTTPTQTLSIPVQYILVLGVHQRRNDFHCINVIYNIQMKQSRYHDIYYL